MKKEILEEMQKPKYRPGTLAVLFDRFKKQTNYQELTVAINALEKEGLIARNQRNEYALAERLGYVRGTLDLKKAGYGFLSRDDKGTDLFIPASQINNAMDGDYCLARITKKTSPQRMEGEISRVLKRGLEEIVGEYYQGAVFPKNNPGDLLFRVRKDKNFHLLDHTLVRAKVVKYGRSGNLEVQVLEVLASMEEKDIDILEVMHRRNLNPKFPNEVLEQVQKIPSEVLPSELKGRRDLRNQLIFTIDGDDTKDIDDAISLRKNDDGHWLLGVHIADVSHYVTKGSPLDK
ncbi:MAG: RNB domain-containing ribonuclease, partial [Candidatus Izemoplasmatales bacterium]|nr:RNB domain-containing ribonuclease [Candidatus Izemoplasmatales bacterium]